MTEEDVTKLETKSPQKSNFGKDYVLFGYSWNPDEVEL